VLTDACPLPLRFLLQRVFGVPPFFYKDVGSAIPELAIGEGEDTADSGGKKDLKIGYSENKGEITN
jgi:hypothetical protein